MNSVSIILFVAAALLFLLSIALRTSIIRILKKDKESAEKFFIDKEKKLWQKEKELELKEKEIAELQKER